MAHEKYWSKVRERILKHDLVCLRSMLALNSDEDFKRLLECKSLSSDITALSYYIRENNKSEVNKVYKNFNADVLFCLEAKCSNSQMPEFESFVISLVWLSILQDEVTKSPKIV